MGGRWAAVEDGQGEDLPPDLSSTETLLNTLHSSRDDRTPVQPDIASLYAYSCTSLYLNCPLA